MILDTHNRSLQIVLGEARATAASDVVACYAQANAAGSFVTTLNHTSTNGTTPVTIVPAPGVGLQFLVNEVRVHNNDSVTHTVILRLLDGATTRTVYTGSVAAGADWIYTPDVGAVVGGGGGGSGIAGVSSWNTRTGAVTMLSADVTAALGFTPYNSTNPSGYQTAANVLTTLGSPPAIGGTVPSSGAFTTLSATGTISGTGFTAWAASPPAIGATAANSGVFTTLSASGLITPGASGIKGVTDGSDAPGGSVGEYLSATASGVAISNVAVATAIASLSLTAGDWDVQATVIFSTIGTGINNIQAFVNNAVAQPVATAGGYTAIVVSGGAVLNTSGNIIQTGMRRFSSSASQTVYALAYISGTYTAGATGNAMIRARRVR